MHNLTRSFFFVLSAAATFAISLVLTRMISQGTVLTEAFLGWTGALFNILASDCIQKLSLKEKDVRFFKIFLGGNFIKFFVLIIFIVMILINPAIHKIPFIFAFAVANFIFFLYYICNLQLTFFPKYAVKKK